MGYLWPCCIQDQFWVHSVNLRFFRTYHTQSTTSTNRSRKLSNFPWIIFTMVLPKNRIFDISFSLVWDPMEMNISKLYSYKYKPKAFKLFLNAPPPPPKKGSIVERNGVKCETCTTYSIQGHFLVIQCTYFTVKLFTAIPFTIHIYIFFLSFEMWTLNKMQKIEI